MPCNPAGVYARGQRMSKQIDAKLAAALAKLLLPTVGG